MAVLSGTNGLKGTRGDDLIVGTGYDDRSFGGGAGDDYIVALDAPLLVIDKASPRHDSLARATSLDEASRWAILPGTGSDTPDVPRRVVIAEGVGSTDYYAVTVAAGETITLDIDGGRSTFREDLPFYALELLDAGGNRLAFDDHGPFDIDGSSDAYLTFTAPSTGTYYVNIGARSDEEGMIAPVPRGAFYLLNIAVTGHANRGVITTDAVRTVSGGDGGDVLLGGFTSDILDGGAGADQIRGGDGDDRILGGPGGDSVAGGAGDDVIVVVEEGGGFDYALGEDGYDRIELLSAAGSGWRIDIAAETAVSTLGHQVYLPGTESFVCGDGDDTFVSSEAAISFFGGGGTDTLDTRGYSFPGQTYAIDLQRGTTNFGEQVVDVENLFTGDTDDVVTGSTARNLIVTGAGADRVSGGKGDDTLVGGVGDDRLSGGDGADTIIGDVGSDRLTGGAGADRFVFTTADDRDFLDTITDFNHAEHDRIDVSDYDAIAGTPRVDRFTFIGDRAFGGVAGQLRFFTTENATYVQGDTDGNREADFTIQLTGPMTLVRADFILSNAKSSLGNVTARHHPSDLLAEEAPQHPLYPHAALA